MKKFSHFLLILFSGIVILSCLSCKKDPACELNNTYTVIIENTHNTGYLKVNIDRDFRSINGESEYTVAPGVIEEIELSSGIHVIKAKLVITECNGSRCSVRSFGKEDKEIDQPACGGATLIY